MTYQPAARAGRRREGEVPPRTPPAGSGADPHENSVTETPRLPGLPERVPHLLVHHAGDRPRARGHHPGDRRGRGAGALPDGSAREAPGKPTPGSRRTSTPGAHRVRLRTIRSGWSNAAGVRPYFTTRLTSLSGTTIAFTTCLPSSSGWTFSSASARALQFFLRRAERQVNAAAQLAVDLDHHLGQLFARQFGVVSPARPA